MCLTRKALQGLMNTLRYATPGRQGGKEGTTESHEMKSSRGEFVFDCPGGCDDV